MRQYNDCMEVREQFSAYLDGELATEEREPLEVHLAACAECLRELDALKRVDDACQRLERVGAPAGFEAAVREAVRTGRTRSDAARRLPSRWTGPLVAMASAAAVFIVGVFVLESRQRDAGRFEFATTPEPKQEANAQLRDAAPAASAGVGEADRVPAGVDGAWDNFARAPKQTAGAWESFTREAPAPAEGDISGGRADSDASLVEDLAGAQARATDVEMDSVDAETRSRANVIGTPPPAEPAAEAEELLGPAAERSAPLPDTARAPQPSSPREQAQPGEVVSRQTLRSFKVRADGAWIEAGYANEPCVPLARGSAALHDVMQKHRDEDWDKMLAREVRQIFKLDSVWYDLAPKPSDG